MHIDSMIPALQIKDLRVQYGAFTAIKKCDLEIMDGEIFGLLGPNAAGKSTVMKAISGQIDPSAGSVLYWGEDFRIDREKLKKAIGVVPQEYSFAQDFTVDYNLEFIAKMYGFGGLELKETVDRQVSSYLLEKQRGKISGMLSGGYKRLLNFALSTMHNPRLLLLDEPTVGLDPDIRATVWKIIQNLREEGHTVILTTHYLEEATFLCDRLAIIFQGDILVCGTPSELTDKYGGDTTIFLQLAGGPERIVDEAKRIKGVITSVTRADVLVTTCNNKSVIKVISALNGLVEKAGLGVKDTYVKEPTLDDVFKAVVGRELEVK
ncbi:MAG: ABC transporter ATP-binding protein [Candidatus Micrarchaeota archaeon]